MTVFLNAPGRGHFHEPEIPQCPDGNGGCHMCTWMSGYKEIRDALREIVDVSVTRVDGCWYFDPSDLTPATRNLLKELT